MKSMGALITSHSVKKSDNGLVIVGGSYAHKEHLDEDSKEEETKEEGYVVSHYLCCLCVSVNHNHMIKP